MGDGKPEAMFLFSQDLVRKKPGKRSLEDVALLKTLEFETDRNPSGHLCQPSVQVRITDFYSQSLRHPVHLEKIVICDAHLQIHIEKTIERRGSNNLSIVLPRHS